jgi:hypothetical protein
MQSPEMGDYMTRFSVHRDVFMKIAFAKWDLGHMGDDGRVYVTADDVTNPDLLGA